MGAITFASSGAGALFATRLPMHHAASAIVTAACLSIGSVQVASAADLPAKAPRPPAAIVAHNWSGLYVGGHIGYGWGDKDWVAVGGTTHINHDVASFIGGGQVGFNYQVGAWVLGAELDGTLGDLTGSSLCPNPTFTCSTKVDWFGTLTGRIGHSWDRLMLYVKGGVAVAHDKYDTFRASPPSAGTGSETKVGWTVGGGFEYALSASWSAKVEYAYMDFGTDTVVLVNNVFGPSEFDIKQRLHAAKLGINYRFGWSPPPIAARY